MASVDSSPAHLDFHQIVSEARAGEKNEQRDTQRYAFFRPVTIRIGKTYLSAFSRDVSETGIGLFHHADLALEEVEVVIPVAQGHAAHIRTQITWCVLCSEGWYLSGGKFVGIVEAH